MSPESDMKQKKHFDNIASSYNDHYDDPYSRSYRNRFIYKHMFKSIDLYKKNTLEAMCGSGEITDYLIFHGATVTGLDISNEMIKSFKDKFPQCENFCGSFFDNTFNDSSFDIVVVIGGLHHLQPNINKAIDEVYRLLKPGGQFCFFEPHSGSFPDKVRQIWMKLDPMFEENENSIDFDKLQTAYSSQFHFDKPRYGGNIAYLLVYSSLILRVPLWLKPFYSPIAMLLESFFSAFQGKKLSCFIIGQWKKK